MVTNIAAPPIRREKLTEERKMIQAMERKKGKTMTDQEKDMLIKLLTMYSSLSPEEQTDDKADDKPKADTENNLEANALNANIADDDDGFPTIMTIPQMAKFLQIGVTKAYEMSHWAGFPAVRIGRQVRVPKRALLEWLQQEQFEGRILHIRK